MNMRTRAAESLLLFACRIVKHFRTPEIRRRRETPRTCHAVRAERGTSDRSVRADRRE